MLKAKLYAVMGFATVAVIMLTACTSELSVTGSEDPAIVTDRTGRQWDVAHARDVYSMNPDYFNYGLGISAIPSVDNPTVLDEDDPGYPTADNRTQVFGVNHNGEQRAYSVSALTRHEVFNDVYPGESNEHVAVTY